MDTRSLTLKSFDGTPLSVQFTAAQDEVKGTLFWLHGAFEHQGRYRHLVEHFAAQGYASVTYDQRGHGHSGGTPMFIHSLEDYLQDLKAVYYHFSDQLPGGRAFLVGHSMGGLVALRFRQKYPKAMPELATTVLSSPFLGVAVKVPAWKAGLSKLVVGIYPKLSVPNGLQALHVSHDPEVVRAYDQDPFVHKHATAGWFESILKAHEEAFQDAGRTPGPIHFLVAGDDKLVSAEATRRFVGLLPKDIESSLTLYENFYHEIFNEKDRQIPIEKLGHLLHQAVEATPRR